MSDYALCFYFSSTKSYETLGERAESIHKYSDLTNYQGMNFHYLSLHLRTRCILHITIVKVEPIIYITLHMSMICTFSL